MWLAINFMLPVKNYSRLVSLVGKVAVNGMTGETLKYASP